jgi:hypothetical protein
MPASLERASHRSDTDPISGTVTRYCKGEIVKVTGVLQKGWEITWESRNHTGRGALLEGVCGEIRVQINQQSSDRANRNIFSIRTAATFRQQHRSFSFPRKYCSILFFTLNIAKITKTAIWYHVSPFFRDN